MTNFSLAVLLWRLKRGLTQAELARGAGIPRPNLSVIEQGGRDVSLRTVRALAAALNVRPGCLVDGVYPEGEPPPRLSRERMERIARAVVRDKTLPDSQDSALVKDLQAVAWPSLQKNIYNRGKNQSTKFADYAWLNLSRFPKSVIQSLVTRIKEQSGRVR